MPRVIRCATCNVKLYAGPGSLGEGKTICRVCRRKARPPLTAPQPIATNLRCPTCTNEFTPTRRTQVYCRPECRPNSSKRVAPKAPASQRGYGTAHRRERKKWKPLVDAGQVDCARCGLRIQPGEPWDLGHTDDRTGYIGPEHQHCNRADGARKRHASFPAATDHLRWEWQSCVDCGAKCYGKRCINCHRSGRFTAIAFASCARCGGPFVARLGRRYCSKGCAREANRAAARASYIPKPKPAPRTHFACGHERTDENTYLVRAKSWSQCRTCRRARKAAQRRAARQRLTLNPGGTRDARPAL